MKNGGFFECIRSGGDPKLLGDDLFDIMDILHNKFHFFILITNGFLMDEQKIDRLKKYNFYWLQVSIDGVDPAYHDGFRGRVGSWEMAVNAAFMVSSAGIPLTIAHSVTPGNLERIDDMCDLAYQVGASSIIIGEVNLSGRAADNSDILLNDKQRNYMYERFEYNREKFKGRMSIRRSADTQYSLMRYKTSPNSGLIIRPNGDMRLDCMAPFVIGNVLKDDFLEIWKEKGTMCWDTKEVESYIELFGSEVSERNIINYKQPDILIK